MRGAVLLALLGLTACELETEGLQLAGGDLGDSGAGDSGLDADPVDGGDVGSVGGGSASACPAQGAVDVPTNSVVTLEYPRPVAAPRVELRCGDESMAAVMSSENGTFARRWQWLPLNPWPRDSDCVAEVSSATTEDGRELEPLRLQFRTGPQPRWVYRFEPEQVLGTPQVPLRFPAEVLTDGNSVVVLGRSADQGVGIAVSDDGGASFRYLAPERGGLGTEQEMDGLLIGEDLHLVWRTLNSREGTISYARTRGGLQSLDPSVALSSPPDGPIVLTPRIDHRNNELVVAWRRACSDGPCPSLAVRRSFDAGMTFDPVEFSRDSGVNTPVPIRLGAEMYVLWSELDRVGLAELSPNATARYFFEGPDRPFLLEMHRLSVGQVLLTWLDLDGNAHLTTLEAPPLNLSSRVLFSPSSRTARRVPRAATDGSSTVLLADCHEERDGISRALLLSEDGGRSFGPPEPLQVLGPVDSLCPIVGMRGSKVYLAWSRSAPGTANRSYFARGERFAPCESP